MRSAPARALRALPTLLRIGVAETVAYRAEFVVWMLTSTMPLIMLSLWTSVASEGPFQQYSSADFVAYFLGVLIVRNLTGNWVAFQISEEVRMGTLSMRLLRPIHPFFAYATSHAAALPFRSLIALPIAIILLISSGASSLTTEPAQLALLLPSICLSWLITFGLMFAIGCCAFWITQAFGIFNFYFGLWSLMSGYLMPMDIMRSKFPIVADVAVRLPFYYMLGAPVELMTKHLSSSQLVELLGWQIAWGFVSVLIALYVWGKGVRHFEAVGG
ncbi:MAG TPA: ABC-2 family transporter protein [Kofleriaceae bacterium]|nr:ABC-2 family transporter protein [Kofleriaceae bacterium]